MNLAEEDVSVELLSQSCAALETMYYSTCTYYAAFSAPPFVFVLVT